MRRFWREGKRVGVREWERERESGGGSEIKKDGEVRERRYSEIYSESAIGG